MIVTASQLGSLTKRWYPLRPHAAQIALLESKARFRIAYAGRRSGKTERAKRELVEKAVMFDAFPDGRFLVLGPTVEQINQIWWEDLKALVPDWALAGPRDQSIKESYPKTIELWNGAKIILMGMDKPIRVEGSPIDGAICDEFADWKEGAWTLSLRPALATPGRLGWCWFIGKPRGRNHYYRMMTKARANKNGTWAVFNWSGEDILDPEEVEQMREDMDELSYRQEVKGEFVNFEGRAYYTFDRAIHAVEKLRYMPELPLVFCFDFNVDPGTAVVCQEQPASAYEGFKHNKKLKLLAPSFTAVIGEVWIEQNSRTSSVCRKLEADWGGHAGDIFCYGDPAGGARKTSRPEDAKNDWEIIKQYLRPCFGPRLKMRFAAAHPSQRGRINSMNTRCMTASGELRMLVDPFKCPHTCDDLDGVLLLKGGSGEIDKDYDEQLTHLTDGLGYYVEKKWGVIKGQPIKQETY